MKVLVWVIPWTIILLALAAGITSWVWMTREAELTANHQATIAAHESARQILESDRATITARASEEQADLNAAIANRNTRIAQDRDFLRQERTAQATQQAAADQAIRDRDSVIATNKEAISNHIATIDNLNEGIADRDENIANANRTIQDQQQQINLLLTPEPTYTPFPTYTPYPTATRRPWPTPRPTYTPWPTPTPITAFQTNYHGIRCQSAPDFSTKSEPPTVGDTVHIYTGVQVTTSNGSGRGYITTNNGHDWVITAAHVVDNHHQVQVEGVTFTVHSRHPDLDVAFIYLGEAQTIGDGWHRFCMGRKSAEPLYLSNNHIGSRGFRGGCPLKNSWYISLSEDPSFPGHSGSPVVSPTVDHVIGIHICGDDQDGSIVVPVGEYHHLIPNGP